MRFDGEKLKTLRDARKWDQHRLAEAARSHGTGITQSTISRYEHGQEPSGRNIVALAAALGVDPRELYGSDDDLEAATMTAATAANIGEALLAAVRTLVRAELERVA